MEGIRFPSNGLTQCAVNIPEHGIENFDTFKKLVQLWYKKGIAESYMVLQVNKGPLQAIPYTKTESWLGRVWQQLQVLCRFTFGGLGLSPDRIKYLEDAYSDLGPLNDESVTKIEEHAHCAFCERKVIDSQIVLNGNRVQVLYNYAPIGLGGERLHFLIVAKRHCPKFHQLTEEEYSEAMKLTQFVQEKVREHFNSEGNPIQKVYVYHKTGEDAGQSVPHWHMHLIMTQNGAQEWLGKLTVLRNILIGSFRLSAEALKNQKRKYTALLAGE